MVIIFDLDGTLANCDHRRHFVDPSYRDDCYYKMPATLTQKEGWYYKDVFLMCEPPKPKQFVPDYEAFNEACDKDIPNKAVADIFKTLKSAMTDYDDPEIQIWSSRSESQRKKTNVWLTNNMIFYEKLLMRRVRDSTPDDQLKEKWLDELLAEGKNVDFVFDDRKKVVDMWRRRGVFVFDCNQKGNVF